MATNRQPRILVLAANGQVGWEAARALSPLGAVTGVTRRDFDLSNLSAVQGCVRSVRPDVIVNCAAYTHVDRAESDENAAIRLNAELPELVASEARSLGALLVHYSTDYVFDGQARKPYTERDVAIPRTVYGATKLAGDKAVLESEAAAYIFRISWVYAARGRNFVLTMQKLARERDELRVVGDQHGSPTWSRLVAEATAQAVGRWLHSRWAGTMAPAFGLYHMAASDHTTWHDFATTIVAAMPDDPDWKRPAVSRIMTADYPTPTPRPSWSVLDSTRLSEAFGLSLPSWKEQFALFSGAS
jgi:dTDP-4-dehydrorhamnose reductase